MKIKLLDEGYVSFVEAWGSDEAIIEAARMSTGKGFNGWGTPEEPGDEKLLAYLYNNKHATPFEMGGMVIEVKAPIFVFREWHRHRCVGGDALLHFNQKRKDGRVSLHKDSIENIYKKFHSRRSSCGFPISGMSLRSLSGDDHNVSNTRITDVFVSGSKMLYRVTLSNGSSIKATADHLFKTTGGWHTLEQVMDMSLDVLATGTARDKTVAHPVMYQDAETWKVIADHPKQYLISNQGRVKNPTTGVIRTPSFQNDGYVRFTDSRNRYAKYVHVLVATAFLGARPSVAHEVSHRDHNRANNHVSNLDWVTHVTNCNCSSFVDRNSRLCAVPQKVIACVPMLKPEQTYDISVATPLHNFVANGFVIHNSQSYNEMSARYVPLPDENYVPSLDRVMAGANTKTTNKQAQGNGRAIAEVDAESWLEDLVYLYEHAQRVYERGITLGIPKEIARLPVPVARYSRMRASANLRNWLGFLALRQDKAAQYEIRVYADAVGTLIAERFPRTWELFTAGK